MAVSVFTDTQKKMLFLHCYLNVLQERLARNAGMSKSGGDDDNSLYWKVGLVGLSVSLALLLAYRFYRKGSVFPR